MKVISYINSFLDMETPLARKRLLGVKGAKAARGESVTSTIELGKDPNLDFLGKAVGQIQLAIRSKRINLPDGVSRQSKYTAKISS